MNMRSIAFAVLSTIFCLILEKPLARGAACCGGSFAAPSLITGDDSQQLTASVSRAQIIDDVFENGKWQKRANTELSETLKLEGAMLVSDQWQAGASLPILRRSLDSGSSSTANASSDGVGDISVDVGYEILPEWDYNVWRPRGLAFLQLTAPSGQSVWQSTDPQQLDVRGRGVWALGVGTVLSKVILPFDVQTTAEIHRSFDRSVESPQAQGEVNLKPGWGGSVYIGGGWSRKSIRVGGGIAWNYEDAIRVEGATRSDGTLERNATASVSLAYLISDEWAASAAYTDQTLFGSPLNTKLTRGATVSLQRRWPR